jgi:hypothetical protein
MKKRNKKSWIGYMNEHWRLTSGFSGREFILTFMLKDKPLTLDSRKVRVTVEEI